MADVAARVALEYAGFPLSRQQDVEEFLRLSGVLNKVSEQDYLRAAFLSNIDSFDHDFFGNLSKQEANMMAPEQRLFLETAWHALGRCRLRWEFNKRQ